MIAALSRDRIRNLARMVLVLSVFGLSACGHKTEPAADAAAPVEKRAVNVATVTDGPALPPVIVSGVAANRNESKLAFKLGGVIQELRVREGDTVHKGDLLATLETVEIDAGVRQAQEAHTKAQRDLDRGKALFAQEVITREQLDDLATAESMARAGLSSARYNQGYARIVAPSDGVVLRRLSENRELVSPGQPVLILSSSGQGTVLRAGLPDRDVVKLHKGDKADIIFDALPDTTLEGILIEIGQDSDPRTGTYRIEIELPEDSGVISGMIGKATLYPADNGSALRSYLPVEALVEGDQQKAQILVLDETNKVHGTTVGIAFVAGDRVALTDRLEPGTRVVTAGAAYLHDGELVEVRK